MGNPKLHKRLQPANKTRTLTDHDERSEKGNKQVIFPRKYDVASELEERTGLALSRTSFQILEVEQAVTQCLGCEWVKLAQHNAVWRSMLEEMINGKKKKKQKMVDRISVEIE